MSPALLAATAVAIVIFARCLAELWLETLNQRATRRHRSAAPLPFRGFMDDSTYAKSVDYTLAKSRFRQCESLWEATCLALVLFTGVLPWFQRIMTSWLGTAAWAQGAFVFVAVVALSLPSLPPQWYAQFHLEARFGFNTCDGRTWWADRLKGLMLAFVLGYPLLVLILKLAQWTGKLWWLWAWGAVTGFQLLVVLLAPVLILPWFNRFTPLTEGSLRDRLFALAQRCGFRVHSIQIMDGSKRSRHSNAFFTGFGRFRKIVLFDTLINELAEAELEAVLAHEIGHFKRKHLLKSMVVGLVSLLAGFCCLAWLARQDWFFEAFRFPPGEMAVAFLLFVLLSGSVTFWLSPLLNGWSRRHEFEADAFAASATGETGPLTGALRKLSRANLSNLTPHPYYSRFYYSHPTLLEREERLNRLINCRT